MAEVVTALAIVFVTAGLFLLVANHLSLSPIPFYILAGLVVGRFLTQPELLELAQWGIAFLVFVFGFRVDVGSLRTVIRDSEVAAMSQLLVVGPIAFGVGLLFGFPPLSAIYFAIAATLSSTIVGTGLREVEIRQKLVHGRLASSVHFFDDIVAIGLILVLTAEEYTATLITSQIGYGVLLVLAAVLLYRHGFPLLVRLADGSDELLMMASISVLIGFMAVAELVGLSIVVGAFAAGIAIRKDGTSSLGVLNGIRSITDFFVAIFFVTLGALVGVPDLSVAAVAATLVLLVLIVNPLVMLLAFLYEGYDARTAFLASTSLNQVSELSLVIVIQAWLVGPSISVALFDAIILAAAATMIATSVARRYEMALFERVVEPVVGGRQSRKVDERSDVADDLSDHVVIVGYGRQGRRLAEECERVGRAYVVIENDPVHWDEMRTSCENYVLGDAVSEYSWETARADRAALLVSTADRRSVSEVLLDLDVDADVIPRADTSERARDLLDRGATFVNVPNVLASDHLIDVVRSVIDEERSVREIGQAHRDALGRDGFDSGGWD